MTNPNQELLTWAVENITEWDDNYTHLRSDSTAYPFYTNMSHEWYVSNWEWTFMSSVGGPPRWKETGIEFRTTPQIITKQEYIDAINALKTTQEAQQELSVSKTGHIHANIMAEYAEVAKTNPEPWEEFEWFDGNRGLWKPLTEHPRFYFDALYRRKPSPPKTMKIGDIVVEACPLKSIEIGTPFFEVVQHFGEFIVMNEDTWRYAGETFKDRVLKAGCIFATEQQAQAVADALNSIYKKAVDGVWNQE